LAPNQKNYDQVERAVSTLQTRYPRAQDLSLVPQRLTPHPAGTGSGVTAYPRGSRPAPGVGELWHRHVPHSTGHATRQGKAPVSPRVPWLQTHLPVREGSGVATCHRACHPVGKGSGVTMCPTAPDPPLSVRGIWRRHMPRGTGPTTRQGMTPVSPRVLWLQTHLPVREGPGIATCPMALSLRGVPVLSQDA
jgi:hypothetical protein